MESRRENEALLAAIFRKLKIVNRAISLEKEK